MCEIEQKLLIDSNNNHFPEPQKQKENIVNVLMLLGKTLTLCSDYGKTQL